MAASDVVGGQSMATMNDAVPGSGYGNPYVDSLISGCGWSGGPITYYFASHRDYYSAYNWFTYEKQAFTNATNLFENVANIDFQQVSTYDQADMVEWLFDSSFLGNELGAHELPDPSVTEFPPYGFFNVDYTSWTQPNLVQGGYGFSPILHELGHALGLVHPHDGGDPVDEPDASVFPGVTPGDPYDTGDFGLNQGIWTVMSYNDGWDQAPSSYSVLGYGWQATPMAFDIA